MRLVAIVFISALVSVFPAFSQSEKIFKTKYCSVHYHQEKDLSDFLWRISGSRFEFSRDIDIAQSRIDRIVERVQNILDVQPTNFKLDIYLSRGDLIFAKVAYYEHKTKSIHISIDNVSDGVLAHEIAHAVICQYFSTPLPSRTQEILTQYVDKYLWNDY
jgi:hypothetical protein